MLEDSVVEVQTTTKTTASYAKSFMSTAFEGTSRSQNSRRIFSTWPQGSSFLWFLFKKAKRSEQPVIAWRGTTDSRYSISTVNPQLVQTPTPTSTPTYLPTNPPTNAPTTEWKIIKNHGFGESHAQSNKNLFIFQIVLKVCKKTEVGVSNKNFLSDIKNYKTWVSRRESSGHWVHTSLIRIRMHVWNLRSCAPLLQYIKQRRIIRRRTLWRNTNTSGACVQPPYTLENTILTE